jgi:hypothetical protein
MTDPEPNILPDMGDQDASFLPHTDWWAGRTLKLGSSSFLVARVGHDEDVRSVAQRWVFDGLSRRRLAEVSCLSVLLKSRVNADGRPAHERETL